MQVPWSMHRTWQESQSKGELWHKGLMWAHLCIRIKTTFTEYLEWNSSHCAWERPEWLGFVQISPERKLPPCLCFGSQMVSEYHCQKPREFSSLYPRFTAKEIKKMMLSRWCHAFDLVKSTYLLAATAAITAKSEGLVIFPPTCFTWHIILLDWKFKAEATNSCKSEHPGFYWELLPNKVH